MAVGTSIFASDYNGIYNLVAPIIGPSSTNANLGYGRNLLSSPVIGGSTVGVSDTVTALQQNNLWKDLQAGYIHQYGIPNTRVDVADIELSDTVTAVNVDNFESFANDVVAFNRDVSEFPAINFDEAGMLTTSSTSVTSIRTTSWGTGANSRIGHRVTVTWATASARNNYFNAGGQIRFDASLTGGTSSTANTKDWDWARILSQMGKIRFYKKATNYFTEALGTGGVGSNFPISSLSTNTSVSGGFLISPTRIYTKTGGGVTGGTPGTVPVTQIYSDNEYQVNIVVPNTTQMIFEIVFDDSDTGTGGQSESVNDPVDEQVTGTITSNLYTYTPNSSFTIGASTFDAIVQTPPTGTIDSSL